MTTIDLTSHIRAARERKTERDRYWEETGRIQREQDRQRKVSDFRSIVGYNFGAHTAVDLAMTFGWFAPTESSDQGRPCAVIDCGHDVVATLILENGGSTWHAYRFDAHAVPLDSQMVCLLDNRDQEPAQIQQRRDQLLIALGELIERAGVEV